MCKCRSFPCVGGSAGLTRYLGAKLVLSVPMHNEGEHIILILNKWTGAPRKMGSRGGR